MVRARDEACTERDREILFWTRKFAAQERRLERLGWVVEEAEFWVGLFGGDGKGGVEDKGEMGNVTMHPTKGDVLGVKGEVGVNYFTEDGKVKKTRERKCPKCSDAKWDDEGHDEI